MGQIGKLYLLDKEYVDLHHHVHRLYKRLGKVVLLDKERIEAVVQILPEIAQRVYAREYLTGQCGVVGQDIVEFHSRKIGTGHEVEKFSERIPAQVVRVDDFVYG